MTLKGPSLSKGKVVTLLWPQWTKHQLCSLMVRAGWIRGDKREHQWYKQAVCWQPAPLIQDTWMHIMCHTRGCRHIPHLHTIDCSHTTSPHKRLQPDHIMCHTKAAARPHHVPHKGCSHTTSPHKRLQPYYIPTQEAAAIPHPHTRCCSHIPHLQTRGCSQTTSCATQEAARPHPHTRGCSQTTSALLLCSKCLLVQGPVVSAFLHVQPIALSNTGTEARTFFYLLKSYWFKSLSQSRNLALLMTRLAQCNPHSKRKTSNFSY